MWEIKLTYPRKLVFGHKQVNWRPRNMSLHYPKLYKSLWNDLLDPPTPENVPDAKKYLQELLDSYDGKNKLQGHRILWVQAWLGEIDCHDTGIVVGEL